MERPRMLTASFVKNVKDPGRYGDGRGGYGLSLLVKSGSAGRLVKSWSQRVRIDSRPVMIGLGSYPRVTLAEARQACVQNVRLMDQGIDPRTNIWVSMPTMKTAAPASTAPTFADAADMVMQLHAPAWKDGGRSKSITQWTNSLATYAMPTLRDKRVDQISSADVLAVLTPIWNDKRETARRVRQRISTIMKWCIAQGHRQDDPAGDAISAALPRNGTRQQHFSAVPHPEVGDVLKQVWDAEDAEWSVKMMINFLALTAARSGEVRSATWDEIDLETATWTIPGEHTKTSREHRVPLSDRALKVLAAARSMYSPKGYLFPLKGDRLMHDKAPIRLLRSLGLDGTVHGFRSSFRDWAAETGQPREIAEAALAHAVGGVEGAYFRSDLFEQRRQLMQTWADYVAREKRVSVSD